MLFYNIYLTPKGEKKMYFPPHHLPSVQIVFNACKHGNFTPNFIINLLHEVT